MIFRTAFFSLTALFFAFAVVSAAPNIALRAQENAGKNPTTSQYFSGHWVDQENAGFKMSIREDEGVFRIIGGDETYGYSLSCLAKNHKAVCNGNGGRLEGENFLYDSRFDFSKEGRLTENWKAYNNLQTVTGKTTWKRP